MYFIIKMMSSFIFDYITGAFKNFGVCVWTRKNPVTSHTPSVSDWHLSNFVCGFWAMCAALT
jgi:hypothetical protein